ncbi:MAG: ATP-binding protein, partial [Bacteroidota bacterium]
MSSSVAILDPQVAAKIAAGEVIERPSAVVRELLDNSIDAGATEISLYLEEGGIQLIRLQDNGFGMSREDLEL